MLFHATHTHTPQTCWYGDKEKSISVMQQMTKTAKEFNIEILGAYTNPQSHSLFFVLDAPTAEAINEFFAPMITLGHIDIKPIVQLQLN